jgi:hypothetical protein
MLALASLSINNNTSLNSFTLSFSVIDGGYSIDTQWVSWDKYVSKKINENPLILHCVVLKGQDILKIMGPRDWMGAHYFGNTPTLGYYPT